MSRWSNIILDPIKCRQLARANARKNTRDIAKQKQYGSYVIMDEQLLEQAVMSRYYYDKLKLTFDELFDKWSQYMIHDFETSSVVFRGTPDECVEYINQNDVNGTMEVYQALPDECWWSWRTYKKQLETRCNNIEIG